jgi:hypothetical protein
MSSTTRSDYCIREVGANGGGAQRRHVRRRAPSLTDTYLREGRRWLCFHRKDPVAFARIIQSERHENAGYRCHAGVLPWHRGHRLQHSLLRAGESFARRLGWRWTHTDTSGNIAPANSLIAAGYLLFPVTRRQHALLGEEDQSRV